MTSTVAESPARYEGSNPQAVTTPSRPVSPMNTIGEGATPLMYACQQSRDQDVRNILAKNPGAATERDRTMKTALHYCAESASLTCADMILSAARDLVDARDEDGYTPIHLAVIAGNRPLIKFLMSKNADVNSLDYERHSVVHWATVCGEVEALELVLDAGANPSTPDIHGGYPIHYAAQMCGPNSEMGNDVRFGLAVLRKLLAKGVDVNVRDKDGRQPILWAASADSTSSTSCHSGSADAILALVNAGANVEADDKDGLTALHCAASRGHTDCLETLVTLCGADVDVIDSNGCTALFYAVTLGHADSTQLLLSFGAEPNRQDRKGRTPAHCGAAKGQLETLRILGTHGANLWVRNVRGDYPLHEAVVSGRKDLVLWLLTQRPEAVNSPNNDGRCPLHIAAINNNVEMCKILLDSQALLNPVMRTSKGQLMTPIDAALHRGNRGCAKYLQLHGGVPASKLTEKSARLRGGNQRGAMSETQSEQFTTPEFAATLSLPGGRTSLGTSPLGEHVAALNDTSRRVDGRILQVRMNDDVAIRHVERIDAPVIYTHRRFNDDSSGEERTQRRRRRRRRERHRTDYVDDVDSETVEEDPRRRRRGVRKTGGLSDSAESDVRKRRRKRRDDEFSDDRDSGSERRNRRRWRRRGGGRKTFSEISDEDDADVADDASDSNWVRNKKRRGEKADRSKRRSKSKEESEEDDSDVEYITVKRTTTRNRKTVTDEEQDTKIEGHSEECSEVEEGVEEEDVKRKNAEVTTKTSKTEKVTSTKARTNSRKDENSKSKEDSNIVHKVDPRQSKKKEVATQKNTRRRQETTSNNSKTEIERKVVERNKGKTSNKVTTKEKSTTQKATEETRDNDTTKKSSTKKIIRKGVKQVDTAVGTEILDKVVEEVTVEERGVEAEEKRERYRQSEAPESLDETDGVTRTVVTALIHQLDEECSTEVSRGDETADLGERLGDGRRNDDDDDVALVTEETEEQRQSGAEQADKTSEERGDQPFDGGQDSRDGDDKDGNEDISKSGRSESRQSREVDESVGNVTTKERETEAKIEEGGEDEKSETASSRERGAGATNEGQSEEVVSHGTGGETEIDNDRRKAEDEREGYCETEGEEGGDERGKTKGVVEEEKEDGGGEAKSEEKTTSEQVESGGSQTDDETKDSRASAQELTTSSPLEKEEGAEKEVNAESGASTSRSRNGGDSSVLLDSGFEPSPRRDKGPKTTINSSKQQTRSARGPRGPSRGRGRGRTPRPCRTDDEQPVTTVSVTQAVQRSMRKYQLERRIFQELLELKRLQIRAGRANEQVLVKRLVDDYHKAGLTVGMRQYDGAYTFRNFEKYLYDQLRVLQSSDRRLIPRLKSSDDLEKLTAALRRARFNSAYLDDIPDNPILCTHGTHRCHHAAHAYTGVPCAAYVPKLNHHHAPKTGHTGSSRGGFLPIIDPNVRGVSAVTRPLRYVDPARPVTLELSHGSDKQVISLPTDRLDRNKRYYVTFTIKGGPNGSKEDKQAETSEEHVDLRHRHAKSL